MKWIGILLMICIFSTAVLAQNDSITVHKDSRIDVLAAKQAIVNRKAVILSRSSRVEGFRIQVISTNNRAEAFKVKAMLMQNFPSQKCYTIFQAPNFRVRLGNFINRDDAEIVRKTLAKIYAQNTYIVRDMIEYTPTEEELFFLQEQAP